MHVEHSVIVLKSAIRTRESYRQMVGDARDRLVELGLATIDQLADEPTMFTSDGDDGSSWVHVTFSWQG
jgi:hypothetical protein